jgi:starch synthase (maltosyl-transferring)
MNEISISAGTDCRRVVIESVAPEIDLGRFAIKRITGESVVVEADVFADGHDSLSAILKFRTGKQLDWMETPMDILTNDRWRGEFVVAEPGDYFYTIEAWVDHFKSWRKDLEKKITARQNVSVEIKIGAGLIAAAAQRAAARDAETLLAWSQELAAAENAPAGVIEKRALDEELARIADLYPNRQSATIYQKELRVVAERELARFGAWYELFPRSFAPQSGQHGTFKDCETQLPRIAKMGFDVLYLPPVHPIGESFRKGKNNNTAYVPGEPGSPWAIGSSAGGHKSIHPELGTLSDFQSLVSRAREFKIEIALDIAFQCSPDHPWLKDHPEWFRHRPDGSIQYAENPPKKYQDIVPFDFECADWKNLWLELKSVFDFWAGQGVKIFRVDNPHTKTFAFWEWCIAELKSQDPEFIFLAEAFTRPKPMYRLAKLGFTQSYNYFPWRNSREELESYFTELTRPPVSEFFRANIWPNTPDILPQNLQLDGPAAFAIRFILAATLGASYGIYGPAFELGENVPREPGAEEYLDSEKYELKHWSLPAAAPLENLIARVNGIRRANPALQSNHRLCFHPVDNDQIIAYTKSTADGMDTILTIVNLSPHYRHSGWITLPLADFLLDPRRSYQMHDLLSDARYLWKGEKNYVELHPEKTAAHIFRLRRHVRTEHDFDYFL